MRREARTPRAVLVTKANTRATVQRGSYLDYVGVRTFDARGRVTGEHRFLGLWTSSAYQSSPRTIPLLKDKLNAITSALDAAPGSHDAKTLAHVLETYPRDELFQASVARTRAQRARGIVNLYERSQVRLFARRDPSAAFFACLVYVPRDRFDARVLARHRDLAAHGSGRTDGGKPGRHCRTPLWLDCMSWCDLGPRLRPAWIWRGLNATWPARHRPGRPACAMP